MFEGLQERLGDVFKRLRGRGRLTADNVQEGLREVRMALLEADVHYRVAGDFIAKVRERALGTEVIGSLTPAQQVVKVVYEELADLMGSTHQALNLVGRTPHSIMLVGLQGSGKTTTAAKLARFLSAKYLPLLVPADVYRPAAIDQLLTLAGQLGLPAFASTTDQKPEDICRQALAEAEAKGRDLLLVDTAGRLHVDEALMAELGRLKNLLRPQEILLVADAMTGQDAINAARQFHEQVGLTGVILTKMDGDARGGAALSIKATVGVPIKFVGVGEKIEALEAFHPDRMASRIMGMGDVLSLIEKAQETVDREEAERLARKLRKAEFSFDDFLSQLKQIKRMGTLESLVSMIPGLSRAKGLKDMTPDEGEMKQVEAIILSMTREERQNPKVLNGSRRRRIALGSGTTVADVNKLVKGFEQMQKMVKKMGRGGLPRNPLAGMGL